MPFFLPIGLAVILGFFTNLNLAVADENEKKVSKQHPSIWISEKGEWRPFPDIFPSGGKMKIMHGNPAEGPADFYFQLPAGYGVPWHFHTPVERVFVDKGTMRFEMRGDKSALLNEGGYIRFPSRVPHRVICTSESKCLFYLVSDGPFDIHLVDENWSVTKSWKADG